jgi:hypothetical protein
MIGDAPPFGMATRVAAIIAAIQQLQGKWEGMTTGEREKALQQILNDQFAAIGVPAPTLASASLKDGGMGKYNPQDYSLQIDGSLLTAGGPLDEEKAAKLAGMLAHEGRHAEQDYYAARDQANSGKTAEQIADDLHLKKEIAQQAKDDKTPLGPGQEALGQRTNNSANGAATQSHDETEEKAQAAVEKKNKTCKDDWWECKKSKDDTYAPGGPYDRYRNGLADEKDANDIEDDVREHYPKSGGSPSP